MRRTWTIIGVADVPASFKWYQSLLGLPETAPALRLFWSNRRLGWNGPALPPRMGRARASSLVSPDHAAPGKRPAPVFACR